MNELLKKYEDAFNECFPLMLMRGASEDDVKDAIEKCLKNGKPYEVDAKGDY